mgnify:CR=1 FL=1|jgi:hypothetical protein
MNGRRSAALKSWRETRDVLPNVPRMINRRIEEDLWY